MKRKLIKKIILLISTLSILSPTTIYAKDNCSITNSVIITLSKKNEKNIMPMADVIIWKYKQIGNKFYRRK